MDTDNGDSLSEHILFHSSSLVFVHSSYPLPVQTFLASIDLYPGCAFVLLASEGDLAGVKHDAEAGVALESIDADGSTALTAAAHKGHVSVVEYLLRAGANTDAVEQRFGWTPLIAAA